MDGHVVTEDVLNQAIGHHKAGRFEDAARLYNALLNGYPYHETLLFNLSDLYLRHGQHGLAVNLLTNLVTFKPDYGEAWCNLGIGFRMEAKYNEAIKCWEKALKLQGDTTEVCSNMASLYSDRCDPQSALHWIDRALAINPDVVEAHWQRGLALLTLRNWAEGWPEYEYRLKLEQFDNRKILGLDYWDWQPTEHLYVHGEQGVGDEVMFLSCLDDVLPLAKRVTVELNAKVLKLARQTWPTVNFVPEVTPGDYTAKVALGSLAARLRRSESSFPGVPYLKPSAELVAHYRGILERMGDGPYIALAWQGGSKQTRVLDRSLSIKALKPILDRYTCVSAQYEAENPYLKLDREEAGLVKIDDACIGGDLHHQAALFKAVDCVVTVQQTAAHVAGSVGAKALVMVNARPHWRYGMAGQLPWYRSVELIRQKEQGEWGPVLKQVEEQLAHLARIRRNQSANARAA